MNEREILEALVRRRGSCVGFFCEDCPYYTPASRYGGVKCEVHESATKGYDKWRLKDAKQKLKEVDMVPELKGTKMLASNSKKEWYEDIVYGLDKERNVYIGYGTNWKYAKPIPATEVITPDKALEMLEEKTGKKYSLEV